MSGRLLDGNGFQKLSLSACSMCLEVVILAPGFVHPLDRGRVKVTTSVSTTMPTKYHAKHSFILFCYQSQLLPSRSAKSSRYFLSKSSNPFSIVQSTSIIATTFFTPLPPALARIGTTISLLLSPSQAMWPGNLSTSATSCVFCVAAAAPQTPRPNSIVWQATFPWKGPRMS